MEIIKYDLRNQKIEIVEIIGETKTLYRLSDKTSIKKHILGRCIHYFQKERYVYLHRDCWKICRNEQLRVAKENYKRRKEHLICALKGTCFEYSKNAFKKIMKELEGGK